MYPWLQEQLNESNVFTQGSQTRKANMESIVTFIDIFIKEKIFHSLTDLNLIVSFRDRAYRTLQEKLKSNSTEEKLLNPIT